MKIAIATDSGNVSEHFGRCPEFTIVEIEKNKVVKKEIIRNPGHATGFLPKFFKERKVDYIIAGGVGVRAQQLFEQFEIKLIIGIQGEIDNVINNFIKGELKQGKDFCEPGKGKGYGIEKEDGHNG